MKITTSPPARRGWSWDKVRRDETGTVSWLYPLGATCLLLAGLGAASGWIPARLDGRWLAIALVLAAVWFFRAQAESLPYREVADPEHVAQGADQ